MTESVLIVGGGPVGLVCGLSLAKAGINVTILEAEAGVVESPRAMGYHWPVLDGLDLLGLLDDMKNEGFTLDNFTFRVFATAEQIVYNSSVLSGLTDHPYMLVLGQNKLAKVALNHVAHCPNIKIHWNTEFKTLTQDPDSVTVTAERGGETEQYQADWVIAADGARSNVRKAVGLGYDGITWPKRFVATNIYYDFDQYGWGRMGFLIDPKFGAVIGKLDTEGLWRVTFCEDANLPIESLADRIPGFMSAILPGNKKYEMTLFTGYGMHQRSAESYRVGRVLLAGDSAHATNPTSGFGLVGGLFDTYALTDALIGVIEGYAEPAVLDRYSDARHAVFNEITTPVSTGSMRLVFHSGDPRRLEQSLAVIRARSKDPASLLEWYQTQARLETPSLITGQTTMQKRAALKTKPAART